MKRIMMYTGRGKVATTQGLLLLGVLSSLAMLLASAPLHAQPVHGVDMAVPPPETVLRDIQVGNGPAALFAHSNGKLYVAHALDTPAGTVGVVKIEQRKLDTTIPVGASPQGLGYHGGTNRIYVANAGSGTVMVIDPTRDLLEAPAIAVGTTPVAVATLTCCSGRVYVANAGSNNVSIIDPSTKTELKKIAVGQQPSAITFVGTSEVWVANAGSNDISIIDTSTDTVKTTIASVGNSPSGLGPACSNEVYVALAKENKIRVVDTVTKGLGAVITVGTAPAAIVEHSCGELFVVNSGSNNISVINTSSKTVKDTISVGKNPVALTFSGNEAFVANYDDDSITVLRFDGDVSVAVFLTGCTVCRGGDHFIAVARVRNATSRSVKVEAKAGFIRPDGTKVTFSVLNNKHFEVPLSPSFEIFVTLADIQPLPPDLPPGSWRYYLLLEDPDDGTDLSRSTQSFTIQ